MILSFFLNLLLADPETSYSYFKISSSVETIVFFLKSDFWLFSFSDLGELAFEIFSL